MKKLKSRNFPELLKLQRRGVVWVYCQSVDICRQFYYYAEQAGFSFGDGIPLSRKPVGNLIAVHSDRTLAYLGFAGHMALQARARYTVSDGKRKRLFIVEYGDE